MIGTIELHMLVDAINQFRAVFRKKGKNAVEPFLQVFVRHQGRIEEIRIIRSSTVAMKSSRATFPSIFVS